MKIKMAWNEVKIIEKNQVLLDGEEIDGLFIPRKNLIIICKNLNKGLKEKVLIHELVHAALFYFGNTQWDNEDLVENLAIIITTILKENNLAEIMGVLKPIGEESEDYKRIRGRRKNEYNSRSNKESF